MTSKIIELKELYDPEAKTEDPGDGVQKLAGDFTNSFPEKIRIDKGDSVKIKSVFINDASGPEGNIVLQNDLAVQLNIGYYVRDWGSYNYAEDYDNGRTYTHATTIAANTQPRTNRHFVLCRPKTFNGTEKKITAIRILWRESMIHGGDWYGFNAMLDFGYTKPDNSPGHISFTITKRHVQELSKYDSIKKHNYIELTADTNHLLKRGHIPFPLYTANNPGFFANPPRAQGSGNIYDFTFTNVTNGQNIYIPHIKPLAFTIPKNPEGYSPAQFAQVVTELITKTSDNQAHDFTTTADNNLLTTTLAEEGVAGGVYLDEQSQYLYTTNVTGNAGRNTWVGSNQLAIVYRDDLGGKFEIQSMHMPLYSGNQEGVLLTGNGTENYIANKHSGIFIDSVTPTDFFAKYFNIGPSIMSAHTGNIGENAGAAGNFQMTGYVDGTVFPTFSFTEGTNCTGQMVSVDTLINKGDFAFEKPSTHEEMRSTRPDGSQAFENRADGTNSGVSNSFISETQHFTIVGADSLLPTLDDPYYLIELTLPMQSQYNSSVKSNKKIQAIVGRYFNTNGYTQAVEGEGALSYVHTSDEPLYISNIKCRILDSKGDLAANIKPDNTVFLEILKQDPNQV